MPFLGDLPGVGAIFRGETTSRRKTDLVILLTPTMMTPARIAQATASELERVVNPVASGFSRTVRNNMYEDYYGFTEKPFSLTPDPKFLFKSESHANAFELLQYAVRRREGFVVVTGDIGTGKTTLCRALLEEIDRNTFTALVLNPFLSEEDLLKLILQDFGVVSREDVKRGRLANVSKQELIETIYDFLLSLLPLRASAVLIIDEAQNLPMPVLEQIRILSNLETDKDKLLQIVLVGQLNLNPLLKAPQMRQLDQRVSIRYQLRPLNRDEVAAYVSHRLTVAGGSASVTFQPKALDMVHRRTQGIPRLINLVCDRSLLAAYSATHQSRLGRDGVSGGREPRAGRGAPVTLRLASPPCVGGRHGSRRVGVAGRGRQHGRAVVRARRRPRTRRSLTVSAGTLVGPGAEPSRSRRCPAAAAAEHARRYSVLTASFPAADVTRAEAAAARLDAVVGSCNSWATTCARWMWILGTAANGGVCWSASLRRKPMRRRRPIACGRRRRSPMRRWCVTEQCLLFSTHFGAGAPRRRRDRIRMRHRPMLFCRRSATDVSARRLRSIGSSASRVSRARGCCWGSRCGSGSPGSLRRICRRRPPSQGSAAAVTQAAPSPAPKREPVVTATSIGARRSHRRNCSACSTCHEPAVAPAQGAVAPPAAMRRSPAESVGRTVAPDAPTGPVRLIVQNSQRINVPRYCASGADGRAITQRACRRPPAAHRRPSPRETIISAAP